MNVDGAGYPTGLKGDSIPMMARMIAVVDAYDAMISDPPYRKGMSHTDAMEEIEVCQVFGLIQRSSECLSR